MKLCLINPNWTFEGSIYFGSRDPHLPLELGYSKALLEQKGHQATLIDAHLMDLSQDELVRQVAAEKPDAIVVTTAPTYLFWRCAQPELRIPQMLFDAFTDIGALTVAVGPHGSTTPRATLQKLGCDVVVMGECEEVLVALAEAPDWRRLPSICFEDASGIHVRGGPWAGKFTDLPALSWPDEYVRRHTAHHHRFDAPPKGPGGEVEASRGCPYSCSFCAKDNFRDKYRRRELGIVLEEIDRLIAQGVEYIYFIDEIFLPNRQLLEALVERDVIFGVQTRIDLWKPEMIELLGRAGCVSIEAGVESITPEGRDALDKKCKMTTEELSDRLRLANHAVPFVQANLLHAPQDAIEDVRAWRDEMRAEGIWANDPVPLFPYPGSPDYRKLWGTPDDQAWERALDFYLKQHASFSDIQEERPRALHELERPALR